MKISSSILRKIFDFIFPPSCLICHKKVEGDNMLCPDCFKKIHFICSPVCQICGTPLDYEGVLLCPSCLQKKFYFEKNRSAVVYNAFSKKLILPFKHQDKIELTSFMASALLRAGEELFPLVDTLIPVPIHRRKMLKRKYNQAALLAQMLSKKTHKKYLPLGLKKDFYGQSQGHLSPKKRFQNVKSSFSVPSTKKIKGKSILLIDDVFTTGATVNECAKTLKKAGAKSVYVLTFAKVLPFEESSLPS